MKVINIGNIADAFRFDDLPATGIVIEATPDELERLPNLTYKEVTISATPRRNCDVGTPKEQEDRWKTNCGYGIPNCKHCKVYEEAKNSGLVNSRYFMRCDCRFIWAQMPYEGGAK